VYVGTSWYRGIDALALDAGTGQLVWSQRLQEEVRATCAAANGNVFVGVDTEHEFHKLVASNGDIAQTFAPTPYNYFVGSSALCTANVLFIGNDNGYFSAVQQSDLLTPLANYYTGGVVCSSPAISYAAELEYRWIYVLSRGTNGEGVLLAFRREL